MLHMVSSHILWPLLGAFKKICKVFLLHLMNNISVNYVYVNTYLITHVVSQNYIYFKIQWLFNEQLIKNSMIFPWFFHFYKFQELFMKFNDFSMILKQIWISMIFQELWEPCICKIPCYVYLRHKKFVAMMTNDKNYLSSIAYQHLLTAS